MKLMSRTRELFHLLTSGLHAWFSNRWAMLVILATPQSSTLPYVVCACSQAAWSLPHHAWTACCSSVLLENGAPVGAEVVGCAVLGAAALGAAVLGAGAAFTGSTVAVRSLVAPVLGRPVGLPVLGSPAGLPVLGLPAGSPAARAARVRIIGKRCSSCFVLSKKVWCSGSGSSERRPKTPRRHPSHSLGHGASNTHVQLLFRASRPAPPCPWGSRREPTRCPWRPT
jgi:hypothetical protein